MNWLLKIFSVPILGKIKELFLAVFGSKQERDLHIHNEQAALQDAYQNEFTHGSPDRSLFDILVDAVNRLVRPFFAYATFYLIFLSPRIDPAYHKIVMVALEATPKSAWAIFVTIITFYFGSRTIEKTSFLKSFTNKTFKKNTDPKSNKTLESIQGDG